MKHQNMASNDLGDDHKEYFAGEAALKAGGTHNTMTSLREEAKTETETKIESQAQPEPGRARPVFSTEDFALLRATVLSHLQRPEVQDLSDLLTLLLAGGRNWTPEEARDELDNNAQGIFGYMVCWIDRGAAPR